MASVNYVTVVDVKGRRGIEDFSEDPTFVTLATAASRGVDAVCGRTFGLDAGVSARTYLPPCDTGRLLIEDFSTTTGLIVVDNTTTLVLNTDYIVSPGNSIGPTGEPWPFYIVEPIRHGWSHYPGRSISVTARWGWPAIPPLVVEATLLVLMDLYATKDLRFGVLSPGVDGGFSQRIRQNTMAMTLLTDYIRADVMMGLA